MRIAVDAMGGDHAPKVVVEGAVWAAQAWPSLQVHLVGREESLRPLLERQPFLPRNLFLHHAPEVAGMGDVPSHVLRRKPEASINVAMRMLRQGEVDAVVTAGNTGAAVAAATYYLRTIPGVSRPGLAMVLPTLEGGKATGRVILMDVGATVDCSPSQLCEFALMAGVYAHWVMDEASPRIALLSNGEEEGKGNATLKRAYEMLQRMPLRFVGNVDAKDVLRGLADVIICDGFVGNVWLKGAEAAAEFLVMALRRMLHRHWWARLGGLLLSPALRAFRREVDYREYGGALLLGVNGIVVIAHGRSDGRAIQNAIRVAAEAVAKDVIGHIYSSLEKQGIAGEKA